MFYRLFWKKSLKRLKRSASFSALFLIGFYRAFLSGGLASGGCCRFYPSCSEYAFLAFKRLPFLRAAGLTAARLLDCRPFGPNIRMEPDLLSAGPEELKGFLKKPSFKRTPNKP